MATHYHVTDAGHRTVENSRSVYSSRGGAEAEVTRYGSGVVHPCSRTTCGGVCRVCHKVITGSDTDYGTCSAHRGQARRRRR